MKNRKILIYCLSLFLAGCMQNKGPAYKNPNLPVSKRVEDLINRMELEEKEAQLRCIWRNQGRLVYDSLGNFDIGKAEISLSKGIGHIARPSEVSGPVQVINLTNDIQRYLVEQTRLGIPAIFHEEGLHGHMADSATHFPSAVALAGSWNLNLVEEVYSVVAKEIRARGGNQALTPVLDVGRDPRWGRFEETFGEDPWLVAEMGMAAIRGFQGTSLPVANDRVAATIKHFAAHGQPESGINVAPPNADMQTLYNVHLFPFWKAVKETGVLNAMASYNEINGIPSHKNDWLLNDVLREDWGFKGTVVSDYFGIEDLHKRHFVATDSVDAALQAIKAGVDIELPDDYGYQNLAELVRNGQLDETILNEAVSRVLYVKFQLGLFENPYTNPEESKTVISHPDHGNLAEKAALQAITLLKNENELLPLDLNAYKRIAVVGPNADYPVLGGYSARPPYTVTPYEGIKSYVNDEAEVFYSIGCRISEEDGDWWADDVSLSNPEEDQNRIEEAVKLVKSCDVAILCLGDNESVAREGWSENHLGDKPHTELVGLQNELVKSVLETGKPVIVLLFTNGPRSINFISENAHAILQCWYLGQESGNAVAKTLFGENNPSGKLVASIPRSGGHLPVFYNHKTIARRGYLFDEVSPLYPFGFGLSYTKFQYGEMKVSANEMAMDDTITCSVNVSNTGKYAGEEVVLLFIRDLYSSVTRPVKELKGFKRVHLVPGETKEVSFTIKKENLAYYNENLRFIAEPGEYRLMIDEDTCSMQLLEQ